MVPGTRKNKICTKHDEFMSTFFSTNTLHDVVYDVLFSSGLNMVIGFRYKHMIRDPASSSVSRHVNYLNQYQTHSTEVALTLSCSSPLLVCFDLYCFFG